MREVKTVKIHYFDEDGNFYDTVTELVSNEWDYTYIIKEIKKRRRHSSLDMVILDSEDGVIPYITPYLDKVDKSVEFKGFFR